MARFVGRGLELRALEAEFDECRNTGEGRLITIRGRRQVGKSALVERWLENCDSPSVFFEAHGYTETRELLRFRDALAASSLPSAQQAAGVAFVDWQAALLAAAANATREHPSVIVLDEFPDLCDKLRDADGNPAPSPQEGTIRAAWRILQKMPVVLVLVGSNLAMMTRLTTYGFPLFGRPTRQLLVAPLSPLEAARMTGRIGDEALDAYLVTGGFPRIVDLWRGGSLESFLRRELSDPSSEFVTAAGRILDGELPTAVAARTILSVIGAGERTHKGIVDGTGIEGKHLSYSLRLLADKNIVSSVLPLSTARSDARRYRVGDPYLRFWLRFIDPIRGEIGRGIGATNASRIARQFLDYSGTAIEPIVRSAMERMSAAGDPRFGGARVVGGFWTKDNQVEIDLVGANRDDPGAELQVAFIGTIKWRAHKPLDGHDMSALESATARMAGANPSTPVVAVSRQGFDQIARPFAAVPAEDIIAAFPAD